MRKVKKKQSLAAGLNTAPPAIIYTQQPSILVSIDGQPLYEHNNEWNVDQVSNTPFTIIKVNDQQFYLYGGKRWYSARSITGDYKNITSLPSALSKIDRDVRARDTAQYAGENNSISQIIVTTTPAELIQADGEPNFNPIQGTNLLYLTNQRNDIFMDVNSQQYYVLISGRWYRSTNLKNGWSYTSADQLPADFAKIPAGSAKDNVLANVAGTDQADESVMNAQIPQTAKVDRKNANAQVTYDGDPQFENIEGTHLRYAMNTPGSVINSGKLYYYVDNGVWFESASPNGPWYAATRRPEEVEFIPARYPVYNVKYVYIYDATPDYIYTGYTPGYLGTYIYGPTIVYGTGYYYHPWRGRHYYPRPHTWGFSMRYDPWIGWGFGVNLWSGWFSMRIGNYYRGPHWGGWWGPTAYHPFYCRPYDNYYGRSRVVNNYTYLNNRSVNIYHNRRDVVTNDRYRYNNNRSYGISRPGNGNYAARPGPAYNPGNGGRISNRAPVMNNSGRRTRNYEPNEVRGREPFSNRPSGNYSSGRNNNDRSSNTNGNYPGRETNTGSNPSRNEGNAENRPSRMMRPENSSPRANNPNGNITYPNRNFPGNGESNRVNPNAERPQRTYSPNQEMNGQGMLPRSMDRSSRLPAPSSGGSSRPTRESAPRQSEHRSGNNGNDRGSGERSEGHGASRRIRG